MKKTSLVNYAKELASMGGKATLRKYGKKHFRNMADKRWAKVASKHKKK